MKKNHITLNKSKNFNLLKFRSQLNGWVRRIFPSKILNNKPIVYGIRKKHQNGEIKLSNMPISKDAIDNARNSQQKFKITALP